MRVSSTAALATTLVASSCSCRASLRRLSAISWSSVPSVWAMSEESIDCERGRYASEQVAGLDARAKRRHATLGRLVPALHRALHHAAAVRVGHDAAIEPDRPGPAFDRRGPRSNLEKPLRRLGYEQTAVGPARGRVACAGAQVGPVIVALVRPRTNGGQDQADDRGGQDVDLAAARQHRAAGGGTNQQQDARGHEQGPARRRRQRIDDDLTHACGPVACLPAGRWNPQGPDEEVLRPAIRKRDQDLIAAGLAQQRRSHLVGGALLLQLRLEGLAVQRHVDGGGRDRRIVLGAIEVDDQDLAFDNADELIRLGGGDDPRGSSARRRRRVRGMIVALMSRRWLRRHQIRETRWRHMRALSCARYARIGEDNDEAWMIIRSGQGMGHASRAIRRERAIWEGVRDNRAAGCAKKPRAGKMLRRPPAAEVPGPRSGRLARRDKWCRSSWRGAGLFRPFRGRSPRARALRPWQPARLQRHPTCDTWRGE